MIVYLLLLSLLHHMLNLFQFYKLYAHIQRHSQKPEGIKDITFGDVLLKRRKVNPVVHLENNFSIFTEGGSIDVTSDNLDLNLSVFRDLNDD